MAEKFDLASLMKGVADLNTGAERIEYLPYDSLREDPGNFYSMEKGGLEGLADNISTVGLLDPIRVRQEDDHYVVISGHRRRAAIGILIEGGEERWKEAVPCIVDRGEMLPELQRLKLIMANSSSRQKTSAEISREAAEIKELLVDLREKGFPLPGRISAYVAEAVGVKESKLKRLHAIRGNLVPELLALYDANTINEETAYQLQQLPTEVQQYLAGRKKVKDGGISGADAKICVERCEAYLHPSCKCPDGSACEHTLPRFYQTLTAGIGWCRCPSGECCLKCSKTASDCPYRCKRAKQKLEEQKAEKKAADLSREEERKRQLDENRAKLAGQYMSLAVLAKAAGVEGSEYIGIPGAPTMADLEAIAANPSKINDFKARDERVFDRYCYVSTAQNFADRIGVSVDFLLGRTEEPGINRGGDQKAGTWQTGTPKKKGWYVAKVSRLGEKTGAPMLLLWGDNGWSVAGGAATIHSSYKIEQWIRIPD